MAQAVATPLANTITGLFSGMGPIGQVLGGFVGGWLSDLISGIGGGKKHAPATSESKVFITNWPERLTAGIDMFPISSLRGPTEIRVYANNADARNIARNLAVEMVRA